MNEKRLQKSPSNININRQHLHKILNKKEKLKDSENFRYNNSDLNKTDGIKNINSDIYSVRAIEDNFQTPDLLYNAGDDNKTLVNKNSKLRNLLIQASEKLTELTVKNQQHIRERNKINAELDHIMTNYKLYAESHQNYKSLEEEFSLMHKDYNHNYSVLLNSQKTIGILIKDFIDMHKAINYFLKSKSEANPNQFLFEVKEAIVDNLRKHKDIVDILNFKEIFSEFNSLIYSSGSINTHRNTENTNGTLNTHNTHRERSNANNYSFKDYFTVAKSNLENKIGVKEDNVNKLPDKKMKSPIRTHTPEIKLNKLSHLVSERTSNLLKDQKKNIKNKLTDRSTDERDRSLIKTKTPDLSPLRQQRTNIGLIVRDFKATKEGEISLRKGDRVQIQLRNRAKGHYQVIFKGNIGTVPKNYIDTEEK